MTSLGDMFLGQCRQNYFDGITPFTVSSNDVGYVKLVGLVSLYEQANRNSELGGFLLENQYYVDLWASLLILKHTQLGTALKSQCEENTRRYFGKIPTPWPSIVNP